MDFFRRIFNNPSEEPAPSNQEKTSLSTSHNEAPSAVESSKPNDNVVPANSVDVEEEAEDTVPERPAPESTEEEVKETDLLETEYPMGVTRPLPQDPVLQTHSGHVTFGQASDQGMVRNNNQDTAMSFCFASNSVDERPDFGVFIVADGMGGHKEGEKASALTATIVMQDVFKQIYLPMLNSESMDADRPTISEALADAIRIANTQVREKVKDGGTTVTALVLLGDQAYLAHIGDSRAYIVSKAHGVEQLTRDHSVVQRLIELDQLTPEEAETHEQRNVLYRAIGQNEEVEPDLLRRRLPANAYILLCSDGLWGMLPKEDIQDIILGAATPQEACEKLVARANTNGGTDNITAVLLKMPGN